MLDLPDPRGLVCGYRVDAAGRAEPIEWQEMDAALAGEGGFVWLHFDLVDGRAQGWIAGCPRLPESARAVLLGADRHMRIAAAGAGLCGVVGDIHRDFLDGADGFDVLRFYLDDTCLVSARRRPLAGVERLRRAMGEGLKVERPVALMTAFLHHVTDTLGDLIAGLADDTDAAEDALMAGRVDRPGGEVARIRGLAVRLRRHMVPQQQALAGLAARMPGFIGEAEAAGLRGAIERLAALGHDLDLVEARARLVGEQISARLAEATNRNLYTLSIVTTIFLPMTLVSGVFGMNLGGLPGQNDGFGFWYGMALMAATGIATLVALRRARLIGPASPGR